MCAVTLACLDKAHLLRMAPLPGKTSELLRGEAEFLRVRFPESFATPWHLGAEETVEAEMSPNALASPSCRAGDLSVIDFWHTTSNCPYRQMLLMPCCVMLLRSNMSASVMHLCKVCKPKGIAQMD